MNRDLHGIRDGKRRLAGGLTALLLASSMLAACADSGGSMSSGGQVGAPDQTTMKGTMPPAALPIYAVGDSYTFDNPEEIWTVAGFDEKGRLVWRSSLGSERVSSIDPILPSLKHVSADGRGITRIINRENELFPLRLGATTKFSESAGMDEPPYSKSYEWSCEVDKEDRVEVPAGTFDTFRVDCERDDGLGVISHYAPDVGYVIKREIAMLGQPSEVRSLVASSRGSGSSTAPASLPASPSMTAEPLAAPLSAAPAPAAQTSMAPAAQTSMAPAAQAPMAPAGAVGLQLAAYKSEAMARTGWGKLVQSNGAVLNGLSPAIKRVEIPGKGTFYRLFATPLTPDQAKVLCARLPDLKGHCSIAPLN
ncbi:MAG: SPOR domain-containing protein [Rhodospirillum sp.]|nr:SPOR domain-containing protein [Rhodospirillum sp.]MCF8490261.1 SPOR domain-containing protein [Rhodospirillum sp.]MCF8499368.1 SPOR domain-containing protein [Rhodospirillum sp.]